MAEAVALTDVGALVKEGDPDRFEAALFAEDDARERLFSVYGLNLECARTPWKVSEPQIGAMRLRWWLDVIEEAHGKSEAEAPPRAHEVAGPLAEFIRLARPPLELMQDMVTARLRDLDPEPMESEDELER